MSAPVGNRALHRQIVAGASLVALMTIVAKAVAGVRDVMVARTFGVSETMDAFFLAFTVVTTAAGVTVSTLQLAVVPNILRAHETGGSEAARRLVRNVATLTIAVLVPVVLLAAALAGPITSAMSPGFSEPKRELTEALFLRLLPLVLAAGIGGVAAAAVQAERRLGTAASAQIVNPGTVLIVLLVIGSSVSVEWLAVATTLGFVAEAVVLLVAAAVLGMGVVPAWVRGDRHTRVAVGQVGAVVVALLFTNLNVLVDQVLAAGLGAGANASIGYASRIVTLFLAVGSVSLGTAALPHFSRLVASGSWLDVRAAFRFQTAAVLGLSVPLTALLVLLARPMVSVVLDLSSDVDGGEVVSTLQMLLLQIPGFTLVILYARILSALNANRLLVVVNGLGLAANTVGDIVLRELFGVAGIALATSAVYTVTAATLWLLLRRELRSRSDGAPEAVQPDTDAALGDR